MTNEASTAAPSPLDIAINGLEEKIVGLFDRIAGRMPGISNDPFSGVGKRNAAREKRRCSRLVVLICTKDNRPYAAGEFFGLKREAADRFIAKGVAREATPEEIASERQQARFEARGYSEEEAAVTNDPEVKKARDIVAKAERRLHDRESAAFARITAPPKDKSIKEATQK